MAYSTIAVMGEIKHQMFYLILKKIGLIKKEISKSDEIKLKKENYR